VSRDATFEEGREAPLHLVARDDEDLDVLRTLTQDAVFPITEMRWDARRRRFVVLLNRFRWEDKTTAEMRGRAYERVQSLLVVDNVERVASQGIHRDDADTILSLLDMVFEQDDAPAGELTLVLAGDGAMRLEVEALEVTLKDVTRPYAAPSKSAPSHKD